MTLIDFPQRNVVFAENQPEYMPLPAHVSPEGVVTCCWKLSQEEIARVLVTGCIWHQVHTFRQPLQPQLLAVTNPLLEEEKS